MSARKKSTSSDESSSGSSTESTSSSGSESGSDTGSSGSESDSSSSTDHGKQLPTNSNTASRLQTTTTTTSIANNSKSTTAAFRRKSSETKNNIILDEKVKDSVINSKAVKATVVNRGQRLSKSSVYSSDEHEENSPVKKSLTTKSASIQSHKKNLQSDNKKSVLPANTSSGGKAPPAVVKQQQQQHSSAKITKHQQQQSEIKSKHKNPINENKRIFSPDNSSDSDNKEKFNEKNLSKTAPLVKQHKNTPQPPVVKAKPKPNIRKTSVNSQSVKKADRKRSISTDTSSSTDDESSTNSSTHSDDDDDSDSSSHSSPPNKKPTTNSLVGTLKKQSSTITTVAPIPAVLKQIVNKSNNNTKTVVLSDSDNQGTTTSIAPVNKQQQTVRKLTRSSSTRKSKHLTGKPSDTDSDIELNKSRSISKSPVKKSSINIVTKSKTKVKKSEIILANSLMRTSSSNNNTTTTGEDGGAISPVPEIQKCPIEGCDSSGHLSGNHNKHFLPEACPIFHNMSTSECKDRTNDRKLREDEQSKIIAHYDAQKIKIPTSEQKLYLAKIRDARARFKPLIPFPMATTANEKTKIFKHIILDRKREPNLIGLVSDYDLQLFREAQAISSEKIEKEFKDLPVGKGIKYILMGKHQMKVWYQSPYPEDVARIPKMYICEFCLRYQKSEISMKRHSTKCVWRHPPGDEIYRKGKLQVWQVDGKKHKQFCQHLCLLAKFFLDHKTLYYEVEPFLFYVMTLANYEGCHIVGYFSKEKNSYLNYNVSCILTLPPYQRKGYGRLLIDFSYLLTRVENKIGSPEKPLSDLGLISYRSYWKDVLLDFLCTRTGTTLSIKDLSQEMAINSYDIVSTLQALGMMKYWKGKHIVLKKQDVLEEYEERIKRRGNFPKIDASCLRWNPFIPPQTCGST